MATVLCMKWGRRYGSNYVNTLYSMVQRNLTVPHRFICLTDDRPASGPRSSAGPCRP